jgi:hypothetical protein
MPTFRICYNFDDTLCSRVIVTKDEASNKYKASVSLVGAAAGWATYATGDNPQIAIERAFANAEIPDRWRKMRF